MQKFDEYKKYYKEIGKVYSPFLESEVSFNSKGWNHILWKGKSRRTSKEIFRRLSQMENAVKIISIATTVQEKELIVQSEFSLTFLGFIAIINDQKLKVILRKDSEGGFYFYSVMTDYITRVKSD